MNKSLKYKTPTFSGYSLEDKYPFQGLQLSIENKAGSTRHWKAEDGTEGDTKMVFDYGYIRGTLGADEDHLDCYVGPNKDSQIVFIIHQIKPDTKQHDEDKVMLGFDSEKEAKEAYLKHIPEKFFGSITMMDINKLKEKAMGKKVDIIKSAISEIDDEIKKGGPGSGVRGHMSTKDKNIQSDYINWLNNYKKEHEIDQREYDKKPIDTSKYEKMNVEELVVELKKEVDKNSLDHNIITKIKNIKKIIKDKKSMKKSQEYSDLINDLTKGGKPAIVGEIRTWSSGKFVKTNDGWVAIGGENHGKLMGKFKEAPTHKEVADKELEEKPQQDSIIGKEFILQEELQDSKGHTRYFKDHIIITDHKDGMIHYKTKDGSGQGSLKDTSFMAKLANGEVKDLSPKVEVDKTDPDTIRLQTMIRDKAAKELAAGNITQEKYNELVNKYNAGVEDKQKNGLSEVEITEKPINTPEITPKTELSVDEKPFDKPESSIPAPKKDEYYWDLDRQVLDRLGWEKSPISDNVYTKENDLYKVTIEPSLGSQKGFTFTIFDKEEGAILTTINQYKEGFLDSLNDVEKQYLTKPIIAEKPTEPKLSVDEKIADNEKRIAELTAKLEEQKLQQEIDAKNKEMEKEEEAQAEAKMAEDFKEGEELAKKNPREKAKASQKAAEESSEYAFARKSAISNKGQDLLGSARHKRNEWKGLEQAEIDGNAKKLVTRDNILDSNPVDLISNINDENYGRNLIAYLAIKNLPAAPNYKGYETGGKKFQRIDNKKIQIMPRGYRLRDAYDLGEVSAEEMGKIIRKDYVDEIKKTQQRIYELAQTASSISDMQSSIQFYMKNRVSELRDERGYYDPTANMLIRYTNTKVDNWNKTSVLKQTQKLFLTAKEQNLSQEQLIEAAKKVIEGNSIDKVLGEVTGEKKEQRINLNVMYLEDIRRKGPEYTPLKDINTQEKFLMDNAKLKGLQWGNSVTDEERVHHMKQISYAMKDLADATGLPESMISFNGKLGLAIGARGKGKALAHYEKDMKVINLTRNNGVGSLAHEWGHMFDNILGEISGLGDQNYASEKTARMTGKTWDSEQQKSVPVELDPMHKAFKDVVSSSYWDEYKAEVVKTIRDSQRTNSKLTTNSDYWISDREMFARAFERYVHNKLESKGRENTYLSGAKGGEYRNLWGSEKTQANLAPLLDNLFDTFKNSEYLHKAFETYFMKDDLKKALEEIDEEILMKSLIDALQKGGAGSGKKGHQTQTQLQPLGITESGKNIPLHFDDLEYENIQLNGAEHKEASKMHMDVAEKLSQKVQEFKNMNPKANGKKLQPILDTIQHHVKQAKKHHSEFLKYIDNQTKVQKSMIESDKQGIALETSDFAIEMQNAKENSWLNYFNDSLTGLESGDLPREIMLNGAILYLNKVGEGMYSGHIKKVEDDMEDSMNISIENETIPTLINNLLSKELLLPQKEITELNKVDELVLYPDENTTMQDKIKVLELLVALLRN